MNSSSDACSNVDYEVFLSFRGADTRQGFTDVLYEYMSMAEIRVFRDDDELAIGDKIESILEAISSSKICMPIFSPRFAESKWCLLEVTKMVELKKTIVPVFYNVTSDDVKLKTSLYSNDLQKLEEKYGNHQVQKWKKALKEVVSNKGRSLGVKGYTGFCKELVDEVLSKLGPRKILDIDYFVGGANKARAMELLDMMGSSSSHQVIYVGIYGMGGIGKTTLTKLIHNECMSSFDHCAFLPDIREFSKCNGVQDLPKYLYDNVEPKSVAAFSQSRQIPNTFKNKKVVLILDDVDSCEQIKAIAKEPGWFGSGSRIIVTTRDKDVLLDYEKESETEMRYLEMDELDSSLSLELFSKCAFRKDSPPSLYQDLSKRVVSYSGGLPLAIMVIGKLLRRYRTVGEWEELIERLDKNPPKEVKDRLIISYEELEEDNKMIFLDIACLFIGEKFTETSEVFYMWKACDLYPRLSLEVLQARSLVKIDEESKLQMHDQLRDFGRYIVRAKSGRDVWKQSRLWEHSQVMEVLKCKKSKENIEAIQVPHWSTRGFDLNVEEFISFDNLKYLTWGTDSKLQGNLSNHLPKLIWLQCPWSTIEPRTLVPLNLVILKLSGSFLDGNEDIWSQIQVLKRLKVLDLSWCGGLERTPVFGENMVLERLDLSFCSKLKYVDPSIARLQHLNYLSLNECSSLHELPESLGELHALRILILMKTSITNLPDSIGRLEKLQLLNLSSCKSLERISVFGENMVLERLDLSFCSKLNYLDPSVGKLQHLKGLNFYHCFSLDELPESLGELRALQKLNLGGTSITRLPYSIGRLEKLESLLLFSCRSLEQLPKSVGNLQSLVHLDCTGTKINRLPASTGRVEKLQELTMPDSEDNEELVMEENMPKKLQHHLHIHQLVRTLRPYYICDCCNQMGKLWSYYCKECDFDLDSQCASLNNINFTEQSSILEKKEIYNTWKIRRARDVEGSSNQDMQGQLLDLHNPQDHSEQVVFKKLKNLNLTGCKRLERTPVFGENMVLERLNLGFCSKLKYVDPSMAKLQHLNYLSFGKCYFLDELPESLGELHGLRELDLGYTSITRLPESIGRLEKLQLLDLSYCKSLVNIPQSLGNLRSLVRLDCGCTKINRLPASLGRLEKLQELTMTKSVVQELPELPPSLTKLIVDSDQLNKVPDLSNLQHLTYLSIVSQGAKLDWNGSFSSNCKLQTLVLDVPNIYGLPGLTCCSELIHLKLKCKYSFEVLPNISGLRKLVSLKIQSCQKLKGIPGIQKLQCLTSLCIKDCPSLKSLENLRDLQALVELELISCGQLTEIPGFGELRGLTKAKVEYCHSLERLDNLTALKKLKEVCLIDCPWLTEIPGLGGLLHLDSLHIKSCPSLVSLENVQELQLLKNFVLVGCQKLTEIPGLGELRGLSTVKIEDCPFLEQIDNLTALKELGGEVVARQLREDVCRKQQSSLTGSSFLVFDSDESVTSSDGSRSFPISQLEGKVVALYFSPLWSLSSIEFTLDLLNIYEKLKAASSETDFEVVCVRRNDDELSFWKSFGSIPWFSFRPRSIERFIELTAYFKVSRLSTEPTLVIVGEDGKVLNLNAVDMIRQHGARAYPFTLEKLEQIVNLNEKDNEELVMEANMLWPKKMQHPLHIHQLVPTLRRNYICNCCNQVGELWSYCCEECDFDLHCECASLKNINTMEQSSILEERGLQFLENPTRDAEGNIDMQGQLLDLHNSQDDASCSEHVNLHAEQSFVCSGSQTDRSCLAWSCCLPFLSFFRS